ncbi:MAG: MCP four helix bundle domain-containing protein, partial [Thaumarchaeota archaeon]|nr:MCP four helix bundle domain-containing protein [Nitrososphaerota archaeon]
MEIGKKLILGALAVSLLSAVIIGISIYELKVANDNQNKITQIRPALNALVQMKTNVFDATQEAYAYALLDDPEEKTGFYSAMNVFDDMVNQHYLIEKRYNTNPRESQVFKEIKTLKNNFMDNADTMFATYEKSGKMDSESVKLFEDSKNSIVLKIDELIDSERNELYVLQDNSISNTASSVYIITILGSVAIFSIIVFSIVFSRKFTRSIEEKIHLEKQLSESNAMIRNERFAAIGELSSRLAHDMRNPLSVIKASIDLLKQNLQNPDEKSTKFLDRM